MTLLYALLAALMTSTPTPKIPRAYLTLDEAAAWINVSSATVRRRISAGKLRGYRLPGSRLIFVKLTDLDSAFDQIPTVTR